MRATWDAKSTEAGLILPFGINLPHDLYLGLMTALGSDQ